MNTEHYAQVTEDEYKEFLNSYDKNFQVDYPGVFPIISHNDFSDGKVWPESIVAFQKVDEQGEEPTEYYIRLLLK